MEELLIVDDNDEVRTQLKWGLGKEFSLLMAGDAREALDLFAKHSPRVVTLDLGLPPHEDAAEEGFACLEAMLGAQPGVKVIVITGNEEREHALRAVQMGAYDYYPKPVNLEELRTIIRRAFHLWNIEEENRSLHTALRQQEGGVGEMAGQCPPMQEVFSMVRKISPSDVSVLVVGESGTGKELVARAVHAMSLRNDKPFVPLNCGAIPEHLLESELFGHEKGAFTGADVQVQGKVEYAASGTLFLDEVGEMPPNLQVKLLRFLQERAIQRVGGRESIAVDVRIIAATNMDIDEAISQGRFREDLYYRLGVITISLPPLRERGEDIDLLATLFLKRFTRQHGRKKARFSRSALNVLRNHPWPGNVRELENRVQRAVIMSAGPIIGPGDLGFVDTRTSGKGVTPIGLSLKEARDQVERDLLEATLQRNGGKVAPSARELGVSRPTLYDLMKKHGFASREPA